MKYPDRAAWEHRMTSTFNKEKIRRFAERITPKSWNIILHQKDTLEMAGVLNILLSIQGQDSQVYADSYGNRCYDFKGKCGEKYFANKYGDVFHKDQIKPVLGMVLGRMAFKELKSFEGDKKGKVAKIINPYASLDHFIVLYVAGMRDNRNKTTTPMPKTFLVIN